MGLSNKGRKAICLKNCRNRKRNYKRQRLIIYSYLFPDLANFNKFELARREIVQSERREFCVANYKQSLDNRSKDLVGSTTGLFVTEGGNYGILPIKINKVVNGGENHVLKFIGNKSRSMKLAVLKGLFVGLSASNPVKKTTFKVHILNITTTLDGPSAGSAFALAFMSSIFNKKIKCNVAITGEIQPDGSISAIGGINLKLKAAKEAKKDIVIVPEENREDVNTEDSIFDKNFWVHFVNNIMDAFEIAT